MFLHSLSLLLHPLLPLDVFLCVRHTHVLIKIKSFIYYRSSYRPQTKFAKVMFCRCLSIHGGGGCVRGCRGRAWRKGGGMHGEGGVW